MRELITSVDGLPPDRRWNSVASAVEDMVRCRQDPFLSNIILQTDPIGELVLAFGSFEALTWQMSVKEAIARIGTPVYRDMYLHLFRWTTMSGSYIHVSFDLKKVMLEKSYHNVLADSCGDSKLHISVRPSLSRHATVAIPKIRSLHITTKEIVRYFLMHSTNRQRDWLLKSMSAFPKFEIEDVGGVGPQIIHSYDVNKPKLVDEPWSDTKLGRKNDLSEIDADALWKSLVNGSSLANG
jgi:hypothetical protein